MFCCQIQNSPNFWKYREIRVRIIRSLAEKVFHSWFPPFLARYLFTEKETQDRFLSKMIVPVMGKDPRWLLVEVCREFQRGKCSRTEDECRFAHPPTHVAIQNGKVTACFDSLKVSAFLS